ncbi:LPXTG cell wall anchor domain-containing protein [Subdoligranulum variabile]|uniref:LPXTG-motif cell wall anchor domain protein n=1 Tax=Subdoligranulum variabile DSM 15176 TaxID=411471 RepID=D1PR81_9FIRM|nr:LPXTG cell wall anchor domain-containing protein [Subdoligranulum variabile]EFB74783.1 LPXTG-motif cell wall anchor domain protein [Subdoligranulum variabile DSM 15176]UWP67015.1 LPXTG cell wall anchor domain-containing protein [Subdoligranulum variabile]
MQKTRRLHRLLAVLVAVLLAVCSLPVSAFAEEQKVAVELDVHYRLDIRQLNDQTISLGELPYQPGSALTGRYSWETLYGKMNLPADTKIKDKQTGETELTFSLKEDGKPWKAELTVELASTIQHPSFRVRFEGVEEPQSVGVSLSYRPGRSVDAWSFLQNMTAYKTYQEQGYRIKGFTVSGDDHAPYTEADHYGLTDAIAGKTVVVTLGKEPENKTVDFTLRYLSTDNQIQDTQPATLTYRPDEAGTDLWDFVMDQAAYKTYEAQGYKMEDYVIPAEGGDRLCDKQGLQNVNADLEGKEIIVHLVKKTEAKAEQVAFRLRYLSTDGNIADDKDVEVPYDPNGKIYDLWSYIENSRVYQSYQTAGYTMKSFEVPHQEGNKTYTGADQFAVTPSLRGITVTVTLDKPVVSPNKTVDFTLRYLSTDNQIQKSQAISLVYDPNGVLTDVWDFVMAQEPYKTYAAQDYTLSDYVIPAQNGDRVCEHRGMQAVTTDLQGKEIVVHLVKKSTAKTEMVDFTLHFLSDDGKIDVTRQASVTYDPSTKGFDAWNYLAGTATARSYGAEGYRVRDFTVVQPAGEASYTAAGQFTVTPALAGKTVTVHLAPLAHYESSYIVHFVDEKGKEFQSAATVKVSWTEGQQLNLMAQLKDTLATVGAMGYTFKTLSSWNGTNTYKGTELVVPGSWELAAHCAKNPAPAKPADNKPSQAKPAQNKPAAKAQAKPAAQQVVKAAAPAANTTKILPKTGLQTQTSVVFVVMLFAALAGAAVYLFALRKKLN